MKEIGNKFRGCGDECSLTDYGKILPKVIGDDHQAAILVIYLLPTTTNLLSSNFVLMYNIDHFSNEIHDNPKHNQ